MPFHKSNLSRIIGGKMYFEDKDKALKTSSTKY